MTFDPFKEFVKHAADCEIMAKGSRGAEKTAWLEMAGRWQRCAENLDRELDAAAHHADSKDDHRHDLPGWAGVVPQSMVRASPIQAAPAR